VCADIAHASVFTILGSSASIITGGGYTGELAIINFPNPFNLKQKTVTLQNPGTASASQSINGTMLKMSIPTTIAGTAQIQIFDVAGELVRTLHTPHNYTGSVPLDELATAVQGASFLATPLGDPPKNQSYRYGDSNSGFRTGSTGSNLNENTKDGSL
jgi:hypothetical protein